MRQIADSAFTIGTQHAICQDYAIYGEMQTQGRTLPYAMLADGCSSSAHTDTGARLIIAAMHQALAKILAADGGPPQMFDLGVRTIATAQAAARMLGLPMTSLDATAALLLATGGYIHAYLYGDGNIIVNHATGAMTLTEVAYDHNAPYYLAYWPDTRRQQAYRDLVRQPYTAKKTRTTAGGNVQYETTHYAMPSHMAIQANTVLSVTIATDGLQSMAQTDQPEEIRALAAELTSYKVLNGAFAQRRLRRFLAQASAQGRHNTDDIALATIATVPENKEEDHGQ